MRSYPILLACLLAAASGSAQQNAPLLTTSASPAAQLQVQRVLNGPSCPVSLDVTHRGLVYLYNAEHQVSPPARTPAQSITVNLTNLRAQNIVALDAHVQGIPGIPHFSLMPLKPEGRILTTRQPDGATRRLDGTPLKLPAPVPFHAGLRVGPQGQVSLDWTLENVGSIAWVQIDRIVYSDGTIWQRPQADSCKVVPNPMVLVK